MKWQGLAEDRNVLSSSTYNHGHNILRIFYVLPNFP